MKLFNKENKTPQPINWQHLMTTQSVELDKTSLLFLGDNGEFKTIELVGVSEIPIETHINTMTQSGIQNLTFERGDKKFALLMFPQEQPAEKLPVRDPSYAAQNHGTT